MQTISLRSLFVSVGMGVMPITFTLILPFWIYSGAHATQWTGGFQVPGVLQGANYYRIPLFNGSLPCGRLDGSIVRAKMNSSWPNGRPTNGGQGRGKAAEFDRK